MLLPQWLLRAEYPTLLFADRKQQALLETKDAIASFYIL